MRGNEDIRIVLWNELYFLEFICWILIFNVIKLLRVRVFRGYLRLNGVIKMGF